MILIFVLLGAPRNIRGYHTTQCDKGEINHKEQNGMVR